MSRSAFPTHRGVFALAGLLLLTGCPGSSGPGAKDPATPDLRIPVEYSRRDNGLKVVLSPDDTAPVVTVAVYYDIGFRNEPKDRTGFAHLFEHLMFQGSDNLGKMELIQLVQKSGGLLNGSTRLDFTNYYSEVPSHKLETILWAEADRMRSLRIDEENLRNQKGVVANEVKVNVLNRPYGGFPWLDLPQAAFRNWYNAHNFYGELSDLEAATLQEASAFFEAYYAPNNAALAVVGDFDPEQVKDWVDRYFSDIEAREMEPRPDLTEPVQEEERRGSRRDERAPRPALAFAYAMPERESDAYLAMGVLDEILLQGDDSLIHRSLVNELGFTSRVGGGINFPLGNLWNVKGPVLWSGSLRHDADRSAEEALAAVEAVIESVRREPVDRATFDRAMVQMRSGFYDLVADTRGRADLLGSFALFFDDPDRINTVEKRLRALTPELLRQTAETYLRPEKRTVFVLEAGASRGDAP